MKRISKVIPIAVVLSTSAAIAGGPPVAGTSHSPPRFVDETSTLLSVHRRGDKGYGIHVEAWISGQGPKSDTVRFDWKQGDKVLVTGKCKTDKVGDLAQVSCDLDDSPTQVVGALDGQLIYLDDQDGKEYLLRDYKVTVAQYPSFGDKIWQIVPDDLLAAGWVKHWPGKDSRGGRPNFIFWTATGGEGKDLILRCSVDGAKLDDIKASFSSAGRSGQSITAETHTKDGVSTTYAWAHVAVVPANLMYGPKPAKVDAHKSQVWLVDHPGQWMCEVRADAKPFRELRFKVDASGMVVSDDMQSGKGAAPLFEGTASIDLRIPKESTFDLRVRPDAMKKSRGFGLPWPDHANVKAILASLPPASGLTDPK